jgi:hypothetical protein
MDKPDWASYEVRNGADGKVGIYTRDYNCRLATFSANTHALQVSLKEFFDQAHRLSIKPSHAVSHKLPKGPLA